MPSPDFRRAASAIWRIESARLVARLARMVRDVDLAEEIAQDVIVEALEQWEETGLPDDPGGWQATAARHRAIDAFRRARSIGRKHDDLAGSIASSRSTPK